MSYKPIFIGNWGDKSDYGSRFLDYDNTLNPLDYQSEWINEKVVKLRTAGLVHKMVRRYAQNIIRPGASIYDICTKIDNKIVESFKMNDLTAGIGFPVGLSINNCAAHDSAVPNDKRVISEDDVIKVDFGTHINGNIIDSAFTIAFKDKYKPLLEATYEATWKAIKYAGPDVSIDDLSERIQETIESYEIELNGKTRPIRAIVNLGGHTIEPYIIHSGKLLLGGRISESHKRMEEGECWAIETFATTGNNRYVKNGSTETTHFMLNSSFRKQDFKFNATKKLYSYIKNNRKTLPFCDRWLKRDVGKGYTVGLKELCSKNIVKDYPPLVSDKNSYTSQFEHTIYLHSQGKEVLSYGSDY